MDTLEIAGVEYSNVPGFKAVNDNGDILTYIRPSGSDTKTLNGTYDVTDLAQVVVNVANTTKVTGTVTGNGTHTINFTVSAKPDLILIRRSDYGSITAVSDRANCISALTHWGGGSSYTAASATSISNAGFAAGDRITDSSSPTTNQAGYSNGKLYIKSGNNSNLWSTSLTYNYELYYL